MRVLAALAVIAVALPSASVSDSNSIGVAYLCSAERKIEPGPEGLKILPGMGSGGFTIATANPQAQLWFDYGIKLYHGFYHDEAKVAFDKAAALDPACAMCAWGQALAHGSTMNYDAEAAEIAKARAFADKAASLVAGDSPKDKALIAAMHGRYVGKDGDNAGYAKAMDALAAQYPDDKELAVLDVHAALLQAARVDAFNSVNGSVAQLETVLARHPDDTAAIHYYIHATEFVGEAPKALPYAVKLARLAPEASHLVHMAAHTLMRVGRYEEVAVTNASAIATDARFAGEMGYKRPLGQAFYYGHNYAFGLAGAMMSGDRDLTLKYVDHAPIAFPAGYPADRRSGLVSRTYMALGRYDPQRALATPEGAGDSYLVKAMRHYGRGEAFATQGDADGVRTERKAIGRLDRKGAQPNHVQIAQLAEQVLDGRALMLDGEPKKAARVFDKAARQQDRHFADAFDPPPWWYPIRRSAAAAELKAGRYKEAETQARASLSGWPDDALALHVLAEAERGQGQADKAQADLATARKLWRGDLAEIPVDLI
jgi:tetratricopeptide (TPR) repeat protein